MRPCRYSSLFSASRAVVAAATLVVEAEKAVEESVAVAVMAAEEVTGVSDQTNLPPLLGFLNRRSEVRILSRVFDLRQIDLQMYLVVAPLVKPGHTRSGRGNTSPRPARPTHDLPFAQVDSGMLRELEYTI